MQSVYCHQRRRMISAWCVCVGVEVWVGGGGITRSLVKCGLFLWRAAAIEVRHVLPVAATSPCSPFSSILRCISTRNSQAGISHPPSCFFLFVSVCTLRSLISFAPTSLTAETSPPPLHACLFGKSISFANVHIFSFYGRLLIVMTVNGSCRPSAFSYSIFAYISS